MNPAQTTITRFRRDMTICTLVRVLLFGGVLACVAVGPVIGSRLDGILALMIIIALWMFLMRRSLKGSRLAADSPFFIATGRYDEAESRIMSSLRAFSVLPAGKLLSLHQLAVLRHAQKRWQESALLCRAVLSQRLGSLRGLSKPSMLLLADDLFQMHELAGMHELLHRVYQQRLNLAEALALQQLQLEYLACVGGWDEMMGQVKSRVQLAELMPPGHSSRTQALLALAARKTGREALCQWLLRRAELVGDVNVLLSERPMLKELWPNVPVAQSSPAAAAEDKGSVAEDAGPTDR